jgi:hypothetical protein
MSKNRVNTALLACEEAELVVVQGAGHVEVQDAKTGLEVLHAAARKSRVGIGVAQGPETRIA